MLAVFFSLLLGEIRYLLCKTCLQFYADKPLIAVTLLTKWLSN